MDGMAWIPGATFLMGSDGHYPEEAPAHKATVGGFWIDAGPGKALCPPNPALPPRRADGSACRHLHLAPGLPLRRAGTTTSARRRAMISPAMHGAWRPVKRDRGVLPAVISTY